jgi:hypothetical protein
MKAKRTMPIFYPKLAAMRAKRLAVETEIAAPYKAVADRMTAVASAERNAREGLERLLRSPVLDRVYDAIGRNLGEHVYREIMKTLSAQKAYAETTTLVLPTGMLMSADPKSVVARVVDWWKSETAPRMRLRVDADPSAIVDQSYTTLDIRLPEIGYRERVMNRF